ncbi:MAG: DUF5683 domain-containing protein [Paludibacteraceae bacterium]|nr:DUF5683 domain-containing protein [Paludibacteraceae bacterium]
MKRKTYILLILLSVSQFILSQNGLNVAIPDSAATISSPIVPKSKALVDPEKTANATPAKVANKLPKDTTSRFLPKTDTLNLSDIPVMMRDTSHNDTVFGGIQPLYLNFHPNPQTALWLAFTFPGLGQIYNRKYWKLPIIYGLGVGIGYAISYTNNLYKDYLVGYQSFSSTRPNPKLYEPLIPKNYPEANVGTYLKNQMNDYRRYRDLSIVAAVALYALTIVDAFVDAQLSDFDISPDLSMKVKPSVEKVNQESSVGVGMQVNF